jgi:hypothetical protein
MMRIILAVALVIALAMSAGAYDILYSNDTSATHDAGAFGIDVGFLYFMANSYYDTDGESYDWEDADYTGMWFPIDIYYGVMDGFEIGVTPIFMMDKVTLTDPDDEYSGTGIGDTWIWAKYGFMPEPMVTARVGFKLATGVDEYDADDDELPLGSGQMDIDGALLFGVPVGSGAFDAALGYRYRMAQTVENARSFDEAPGSEFHFFASYTYFLNDAMGLRIGTDGYFGGDPTIDGDPIPDPSDPDADLTGSSIVYVNPGFDYIMDSGMTLGFDMHYPLMGTNVDIAMWGLGLTVGWGS